MIRLAGCGLIRETDLENTFRKEKLGDKKWQD